MPAVDRQRGSATARISTSTHFTPDGLSATCSRLSIVTDHIERFTKHGILLKSGQELAADIIISATGLNMIPFGKIEPSVDGHLLHLPDHGLRP